MDPLVFAGGVGESVRIHHHGRRAISRPRPGVGLDRGRVVGVCLACDLAQLVEILAHPGHPLLVRELLRSGRRARPTQMQIRRWPRSVAWSRTGWARSTLTARSCHPSASSSLPIVSSSSPRPGALRPGQRAKRAASWSRSIRTCSSAATAPPDHTGNSANSRELSHRIALNLGHRGRSRRGIAFPQATCSRRERNPEVDRVETTSIASHLAEPPPVRRHLGKPTRSPVSTDAPTVAMGSPSASWTQTTTLRFPAVL